MPPMTIALSVIPVSTTSAPPWWDDFKHGEKLAFQFSGPG